MEVTDVLAEVCRLAEPFKRAARVEGSAVGQSAPAWRRRGSRHELRSIDGKPFHVSRFTFHVPLPLVELTGGEPLLQKNSLPLMAALCDGGFTVLLETSGAHDISKVDPRVRRIVDLKCPSSGESARTKSENIKHLRSNDEIKFVIGTREDYEWAKRQIAGHNLAAVCALLFSWVHPLSASQRDKSLKPIPPGQTPISRQELAEKIIADALPVRFQAQLHKIIWPAEKRGV